MISVLLLPLLIGSPAQPAVTSHDDPPIRLWINNDRRFLPGDRAKVQVRTGYDGYLIVFHVDPEGHLRVLFPLDPDRDNFVRGGKKYEIRGRGGRESFEVDNTTGKGTVYAAVSRDPFRFDGFVLEDHWDYRALAPSRLSDDPEAELNELVRRLAQSSFDYDLLNYFVTGRAVAYRSDYYSPGYYGSVYDDPWCYSFSCGYYRSPYGLSIGLFFGRRYRPFFYDPYFYPYEPFYRPFFYDPYYRPVYGYPYRSYDRFPTYRNRYTPYRFRGADGFTAGYLDRRGPTRWVNTVYHPPISSVREAPVATPGRRLASPTTELSGDANRGREVRDGQRVDRRPIEARRVQGSDGRSGAGNRQDEPRLVRRQREVERPDPMREEPIPARPSPAREARPDGGTDRAPAPEARPSRREVDRPSAPPPSEGRGSSGRRPDEGGRRRR